ncbi:MAG: 2-oxoglutarate dehydrogenase E1 component [Verrucomicrobiales bacterium]|nr:2-oxoglutarate dehydrogenase E1 component [Verrucomicrobiales bacterium]
MNNSSVTPHGANLAYIEAIHDQFREDPDSVPAEWREYFAGNGESADWAEGQTARPSFEPPGLFRASGATASGTSPLTESASERLNRLVRAYRVRGHIMAKIDPLGRVPSAPPELDPAYFGFSEADMDREFWCETLFWPGPMKLREILDKLRTAYCRSIGAQYMHIDALKVRRWLQRRIETTHLKIELSREQQLRVFSRLSDAVVFEEFIRRKFLGAKSFSLEGCETLVPLLDLAIEKAGDQGVREIVFGMAHRGRLNVMANILGKSPAAIFHEFDDDEPEKYLGGGDVKYHLGHSGDWETANGNKVHLSLCFNPSHLEFINPVALGRVRVKQDRVNDRQREKCMAILIHGDAAFIGEGIVQETLNLSQLDGYATGGTLHVIVNNQIGFTTSPYDSRSGRYATEVARMLQGPLFHVNGEDPEAVMHCLEVAMDYRREFKRDVVIDMYGYRRLGHNETDEPSFTQPLLYRDIAKRPPVGEAYLEHLLKLGGISREEADEITESRRTNLENALSESRKDAYRPPPQPLQGVWARSRFHGGPESEADEVKTGVKRRSLEQMLNSLTRMPDNFNPHPKLKRLQNSVRGMAEGKMPLSWAAAEALAFGTLAAEGVRIRLSGQDCQRGTFSQRHAVWHDHENGSVYMPLQHVAPEQAPVGIHNSPLSEAGVLGFEYGYSLDCPDGLVMWEAQFGDFVNVAQVIIDQFITSAEDKWRRLSGLTLLLPHGFEGMGPEHASARLERFLQLCAEDNIQVAQPTTPAQYFHLLRRQGLRLWRKPLVVMTPKSLLRHPDCVSTLDELAEGGFQRVIADEKKIKKPRRILVCSGKIYYELHKHRAENKIKDVAIVRMEQYYPWREDLLEDALSAYPEGTPMYWVQDEPVNMGAWAFLRLHLSEEFTQRRTVRLVSRAESASPATGSAAAHKLEQAQILDEAFSAND